MITWSMTFIADHMGKIPEEMSGEVLMKI